MQKPGPDGAAGTARPLSVDPAQWDECPLLAGVCRNGTARATFHRRATLGLNLCQAEGAFLAGFWSKYRL